jgi:hypothetical protein
VLEVEGSSSSLGRTAQFVLNNYFNDAFFLKGLGMLANLLKTISSPIIHRSVLNVIISNKQFPMEYVQAIALMNQGSRIQRYDWLVFNIKDTDMLTVSFYHSRMVSTTLEQHSNLPC